MNRKITTKQAVIALLILVSLTFQSCSGDEIFSSNDPAFENNLTLSIKADETISDGDDIIITEAKALIDKVELEALPSPASLPVSSFVVNLNSVTSPQLIASAIIPEGNYSKIKFEIHKPEDNEIPPDAEFKTGTGGNERFSIIIKGTYNGSSFIFKSKRSANLVIPFDSLLNVRSDLRNATLLIKSSLWFKNGNTILDPRDEANESIIENNIKGSFRRAFKDDNRDGHPDE